LDTHLDKKVISVRVLVRRTFVSMDMTRESNDQVDDADEQEEERESHQKRKTHQKKRKKGHQGEYREQ
jgi:hypothetical protein